MEIDVTEIVVSQNPTDFSNSVANSGRQDIGQVTWRNACDHVTDAPLVTSDQQDELREWLRGFGAWDQTEIDAMSDDETNALLLQFISSDIQEMERSEDYHEINCNCGGRLVQSGGRWYYYVGD